MKLYLRSRRRSLVIAFIARYNQTARPFSWKYTADDFAGLIRRISERGTGHHAPIRTRDGRLTTPDELPENH